MIWGDDDLQQNIDQIFVEPPDSNVETDEDSADEDRMIHNLNALNFRRETGQVYLKYKTHAKVPGQISISKHLFPGIRFDKMDHLVVPWNRRRCAGAGCKSFGRTMCQKCDVGICINCFATYLIK
ncbi:hypothetical protein JTB14_003228 [Gonioctena quinquepunctata]|nr:hypothetical protein JTB14_003228 [Gonioctena quinquepunctata]